MNNFALYMVLFFSMAIFPACQSGQSEGPMAPEMAKNMLKLRGYEANEAGFFKAVKQEDVVVFKAFWDSGISPDSKNEKGETLLTYATVTSEKKTIKALLEKADINLPDANGNTPLYLALQKKRDDIFDFLLEAGANVNATGSSGKIKNQSVLYLAVVRGREDLIPKLLEKGADPNIADSDNAVALAEACIGATASPEIVRQLLEKGANINHQEKNGATPLIYIASNQNVAPSSRKEIIKMLLEKNADKTLKDSDGKTALNWAKQNGNTDAADLLK